MHDEVRNPFPGLRPFEFEDNHLFFGRDEQTTELTTRLRKNRFVAVVGTSGSGKSSLVRAGLLPELLSGTMAGAGSSWETSIMRPGGDPLTNLANSIIEADLYDPDEEDIVSQVRATLTRSGLGLVEAMRQSDLPEGTNFLLVVDQFEEIFRFRRSDDATDEQAAFFVNLLLEASAQSNLPLYIIITMRSDFLGECSQFPRLADTVNEGEFLIPRLNRDQRKEAILGPVKVAGGGITDRLLLRLLNDIGDDPDQLPILQHALMRTWDLFEEQDAEGDLDLEHYNATGGMAEALSRHADEVYNEQPDDEHKRIAEKLFKSLTEKVDANRGIRRPMALKELHEICGGEEDHLRAVIDSFRRTGCTFLMPAGERAINLKSIIDISHESLMRVWRSLRNWVDEEAQSAKIYRRLADTATLFKDDKAGLYRDPDLQIALSWREENRPNKTWADRYYPGFEGAMAFLDDSHEEAVREEREREEARQREVAQAKALAKARARSAAIFKFACVGVTILAITAVFAMIDARKSRDEADRQIINLAKRSIATGEAMDAESDHLGALVWYADAIRLAKKDPAIQSQYQNLFRSKLDNSVKLRYSVDVGEPLIYASMLPYGTNAVASSNNGNYVNREENYVYLVDLTTGNKRKLQSVNGLIWGTKTSPDGTRAVFTELSTKTHYLVGLPNGESILRRQFPLSFFGLPVFSEDGKYLVIGGNMQGKESTVFVLNAETGEELGSVSTVGAIRHINIRATGNKEFSFSGNEAGFTGGDKHVHYIWNWEKKELSRFSEVNGTTGVVIGGISDPTRGNRILDVEDNPESPNMVANIQVLDQETKKLIYGSTKKNTWIFDFKLSPNSKYLAVGRHNGTIEIHDMETMSLVWESDPGQLGVVEGILMHGNNGSLSFSPDGYYIMATGGGNNLGVWETVSGKIVSSNFKFNGELLHSYWSKTGNSFFAGSKVGELRRYDLPNPQGDQYVSASEFTTEYSMTTAEAVSMRFIDDGRMTPFNTGGTNSVPDLDSISNIYQHETEKDLLQWHTARARAGTKDKLWSMVNYHFEKGQGYDDGTDSDLYNHMMAALNTQQYEKARNLADQIASSKRKPTSNRIPELAKVWPEGQWYYSGHQLFTSQQKAFDDEFVDVRSLNLGDPHNWNALKPIPKTGAEARPLTEDDHWVDAPDSSVYYVASKFNVKNAGVFEFELDSDDMMKVWIDGNKVHQFYNNFGRGLQFPGRDFTATWLDKGTHVILIKIINTVAQSGFYSKLKESPNLLPSIRRQAQYAMTGGDQDVITEGAVVDTDNIGALMKLAEEAALYELPNSTLTKLRNKLLESELLQSIHDGTVNLNTSFLKPETELTPEHFKDGLTVECFIKTSDRFGFHHIMANGGSFNESGVSLLTTHWLGGIIQGEFQNKDTNEKVSISTTFPFDDKWHHVAMSYDPGTKQIHLYFDGESATNPVAFNSPLKFNPKNLRIGDNIHRRIGFYGGITDFRIWPTALEASAIAKHAQGEPPAENVKPLIDLPLRSNTTKGQLTDNESFKATNVKWASSEEPHPMEKGTDWSHAELQYQMSDYANEFTVLGALEYRMGNYEKALELLVKACNDGSYSPEVMLFPFDLLPEVSALLAMAYKKNGNVVEYERIRGITNVQMQSVELKSRENQDEFDVLKRIRLKTFQREMNAMANE